MTLRKLWAIAYRDLGRNRRRSFFTILAIGLGLALLLTLNGFIGGIWDDALQNTIRLESGHVQIRAASYEREKLSLKWADLIEQPDGLATRAMAMPEVKTATPVLWATTILITPDDSAGLQLFGIETGSAFYDPVRDSMVGGTFLTADDRDGILIGQPLADELGLTVGDKVSLSLINADGEPDEAIFTIRGLFATDIYTYDHGAVFLPLAKAQAFTGDTDRASSIVVMLHDQDTADAVAAALGSDGLVALTWEELNRVLLETLQLGLSFYVILDIIVFLVVAVIIINTLLMSVFERIREMGILSALGMRGGQIMQMFLLEAVFLGLGGVVLGLIVGGGGVGYLATKGIYFGSAAAASADSGFALGSTMYGRFIPSQFVSFSLWTLVVTMLASLYPARFASKLEPVEALRDQ